MTSPLLAMTATRPLPSTGGGGHHATCRVGGTGTGLMGRSTLRGVLLCGWARALLKPAILARSAKGLPVTATQVPVTSYVGSPQPGSGSILATASRATAFAVFRVQIGRTRGSRAAAVRTAAFAGGPGLAAAAGRAAGRLRAATIRPALIGGRARTAAIRPAAVFLGCRFRAAADAASSGRGVGVRSGGIAAVGKGVGHGNSGRRLLAAQGGAAHSPPAQQFWVR